jgi:uncharacterized protein YndB with AHSA1/START domain
VAFRGEFIEIVPGERIVRTEIFEGVPDAVATSTTTLTEADGRTTMAMLVEHTSRENRDMHLNSGMEAGMQESLSQMEQVAQSLE